jgi:hypothetical protein
MQDWPMPENMYIKFLPWVVYILNEVRRWKRWNLTAVNTTDEREEGIPVVPRHWRCVHILQVVTLYCTNLLLLVFGRNVYYGHKHGQRSYWRSLALKVSSEWRLTDHREGQKHTNLDVISPTHVQATTAYERMDLHFHYFNLKTKQRPVTCLIPSHLNSTSPVPKNGRLGKFPQPV